MPRSCKQKDEDKIKITEKIKIAEKQEHFLQIFAGSRKAHFRLLFETQFAGASMSFPNGVRRGYKKEFKGNQSFMERVTIQT